MSTDEEMQVIGRMVTELAEIKRRITALEEKGWQYGRELEQISKAFLKIRFGTLEIDFDSLPKREALMELLTDLRAARERRGQLQESLRQLGVEG